MEEAIAVLRERLASRPKEWDALRLKALAETGLGRYDAALQDYETILEKKPSDAEAHRDLGMLLAFKIKDRRHALIHLDRYLSLELDHGDAKILERTVAVMRSLSAGQSKAERRVFEEILGMAKRFSEEGKSDFAIRTYERVLEMQPTCVTCHESLGWLLKRANRHREAKRHMAKARLFRENG